MFPAVCAGFASLHALCRFLLCDASPSAKIRPCKAIHCQERHQTATTSSFTTHHKHTLQPNKGTCTNRNYKARVRLTHGRYKQGYTRVQWAQPTPEENVKLGGLAGPLPMSWARAQQQMNANSGAGENQFTKVGTRRVTGGWFSQAQAGGDPAPA